MSRPFLKGLLTDVNQAHLSLSVADHYGGKEYWRIMKNIVCCDSNAPNVIWKLFKG